MRYETLTDEELIRYAQQMGDPVTQALIERLEMRLRDIEELDRQLAASPNDPRQLTLPLEP